jgi:hypothetical protein
MMVDSRRATHNSARLPPHLANPLSGIASQYQLYSSSATRVSVGEDCCRRCGSDAGCTPAVHCVAMWQLGGLRVYPCERVRRCPAYHHSAIDVVSGGWPNGTGER